MVNNSKFPLYWLKEKILDFSRTPEAICPGLCCKPAMFKYRDNQQLLTIHIVASIVEYVFITVTCCEEIAKKLLEHFFAIIEVCGRTYFGVCVRIVSAVCITA